MDIFTRTQLSAMTLKDIEKELEKHYNILVDEYGIDEGEAEAFIINVAGLGSCGLQQALNEKKHKNIDNVCTTFMKESEE